MRYGSLGPLLLTSLAIMGSPGPATISLVAQPVGPSLRVYPFPGVPAPSQTYPNPWNLDDDPRYPIPQVFLVTRRAGDWLQVLLILCPLKQVVERLQALIARQPFLPADLERRP